MLRVRMFEGQFMNIFGAVLHDMKTNTVKVMNPLMMHGEKVVGLWI